MTGVHHSHEHESFNVRVIYITKIDRGELFSWIHMSHIVKIYLISTLQKTFVGLCVHLMLNLRWLHVIQQHSASPELQNT